VLSAAAAQRATIKPEHLMRLIDTEKVTVGDDGQVTGAEDAVKAFLDSNPDYVGSDRPKAGKVEQGARGGSGGEQLSRDALNGMTAEQIVEARKAGKFEQMLSGKS
jgi:hypothetical protein